MIPDGAEPTCAGSCAQAQAPSAAYRIDVRAVMTDSAFAYTNATIFRRAVGDLGVKHGLVRPRRSQTNGKVERLKRTLLWEWTYIRAYPSR